MRDKDSSKKIVKSKYRGKDRSHEQIKKREDNSYFRPPKQPFPVEKKSSRRLKGSAAPSSNDAYTGGGKKYFAPDWVKKIAQLQTDKGREKHGKFLIEGTTCIKEAILFSPNIVEKIKVLSSYDNEEMNDLILKHDLSHEVIDEKDFNYICGTQTSQGIIAVCRTSVLKPNYDSAKLVVLVDSIQDPGNLGSIFRTSLGYDVDSIIMGKGTCDPFNSKVVRGSSGTMLRVPFENRVDLAERISFLRNKGFTIVATSPHAKSTLRDVKLRKKVAFLVGNEGAGAQQGYMDMADETVKIPMPRTVESLNVAVAHGIVCSELYSLRN